MFVGYQGSWGPGRACPRQPAVVGVAKVPSHHRGALAAQGILAQGDWFHADEKLKTCLGKLERHAYHCISEEYKAQREFHRRRRLGLPTKRARANYRRARQTAREAIEHFDRALPAEALLRKAMGLFDEHGHWLPYAESAALIREGLALLQKADAPYRKQVAHAFDPDAILNFKAVIETALLFPQDLPRLTVDDFVRVTAASAQPSPTDPKEAIVWALRRILDRKMENQHPRWPQVRERILQELEMPFRGSSWVEALCLLPAYVYFLRLLQGGPTMVVVLPPVVVLPEVMGRIE